MQVAQKNNQQGFTIVEIMIVIGIIGVLMAFLYPAFTGQREKAKRTATSVEMKRIQSGIEQFKEDVGEYPRSLEELIKEPTDDRRESWHGPYAETRKGQKKLADAFGNPYRYNVTEDAENAYEFTSYGGSKGKQTPRKEWLDVWKQ